MSAHRPSQRVDLSKYLAGILAGDRIMLSRAITLIESTLSSDQELANQLIQACLPHTGKAYRIGITGVPGVGKSTFIEAFGLFLADELQQKVAVLAVDPSSPHTKGSILGDKTRMDQLSRHERAYVRPSPTAGTLGGVSQKTRESLLLCEAAGYDFVLVETVGVGQSESVVRSMVDFFLLMTLPNAGDELQGIKKGIIEQVDAVMIHKADGEGMAVARTAQSMYKQVFRLIQNTDSGWKIPVILGSALTGTGIQELWKQLQAFRELAKGNHSWEKKRIQQSLDWFHQSLEVGLLAQFYADPEIQMQLQSLEAAIRDQALSPRHAAESLLGIWRKNSSA